ncbi:MAG: hypothetical protein JW828_04265, partial [Sedimentisphaerales bacterium]|nr:hypothetical protein [Sedimentisphaerales bacterium]
DQTMLWFGIPNTTQPLAQPTQQPVPIHPLPRQQATSPVTFQWQPCTDPAVRIIWAWTENEDTDEEIEADGPLDKNATQWGPVALESGFWEAGMSFINGYHPVLNDNTVNSDGIAYAVIKSTEVEYDFAVDRPWVAYQVWGGDVSYLQEPDWWEYYFRPGQYGYTLLGESDGSSEVFYGNYSMYVILARQPVHVDCIRGSDGSYYRGNYTTACVDNWNNISGPCDGSHATIGTPDCDGEGIFILTSISDWAWLRVVTDTGCPFADLSGDCFVGLADLAVLAEHWMTGRQ